jgi:hypothetical protein
MQRIDQPARRFKGSFGRPASPYFYASGTPFVFRSKQTTRPRRGLTKSRKLTRIGEPGLMRRPPSGTCSEIAKREEMQGSVHSLGYKPTAPSEPLSMQFDDKAQPIVWVPNPLKATSYKKIVVSWFIRASAQPLSIRDRLQVPIGQRV